MSGGPRSSLFAYGPPWFARGRAVLGGVRPWRAWALLWAYAFKYERLARRFA